MMTPSYLIAVAIISLSSIVTAQTQPVGVYIKSPRTAADPGAKLAGDRGTIGIRRVQK